MLPIRLEMRNFLAYRAPEPIVFTGLRLACLSGPNGVGKSSLLDAITWALWGKARASRDDELIHSSQSEMGVALDFEQDGMRYRVSRRRARAGRGSRGALDLMVWGANDRPRLINEDGTRRTQRKINQILRLDYHTFVHSAFLQQGRADAFARQTPAERKSLLAEILSLGQWSAYEDAVKGRLSEIASQLEILEHDMRRAREEIARQPEVEADLAQVLEQLADAQARLQQASAIHLPLAHAADALRRERSTLAELESAIAGLREDSSAAEAEIARQDARIAEYRQTIDQSEQIEAGYAQLAQARESQSAVADLMARKAELDRRTHRLERALAEKEAQLRAEARVLEERVRGHEAQLEAAAQNDVDELRSELAELAALDARRDQATRSSRKMRERRSALSARLHALTSEGRALNERLTRLQEADGALCPLCGQELTAEHRDSMLKQLTAERDDRRQQYRQRSAEIDEIDATSLERQTKIDAWGIELARLPRLQGRLGAADEMARAAEAHASELELERGRLQRLEARLAQSDYGGELRRQLADLREQSERLGYDPGWRDNIKEQLETYAAFEGQRSQLEFAQANLPEAQTSRADAAARLQRLRERLAQDEARHETAIAEIAALEDKVAQEREQRREVERIRAEAQGLGERKIIHEQERSAIEAGKQSLRRLAERQREARQQQGLFQELRLAFSRRGLPAMIIDSAIPELEAEANSLLARMSDGRMRLRLHTQRETAGGGTAETLAIEIADDLGARSYELYSGGEAFRINFALRVALSKLLARRAGAQLRALFIDEGFGSQDEEGRDKLVDAINRVQEDFDLILVITHIDELRDAFPAQLLVRKTDEGSIVKLA